MRQKMLLKVLSGSLGLTICHLVRFDRKKASASSAGFGVSSFGKSLRDCSTTCEIESNASSVIKIMRGE